MSFRIFIIFAICIAFTGMTFAQWHSFTNTREENLQINVLSSTYHETKIEVKVPGYRIVPGPKVDGKQCIIVSIPGASWLMEKGFPLLPKLANLVQVQACEPRVEVISKDEVEVDLKGPIVPSQGHLTRNIDPETVPLEFGPIYFQNTFWVEEKDQFSIGKPFTWRDVHGVRLQVIPVTANHVTMKMKVLKSAVLVIKCDERSVLETPTEAPSPVFNELYGNAFLNYAGPARGAVPPDTKQLLIIVPQDYEKVTNMQGWIAIKKQKGYTVTTKVITTETATQIKDYIQAEYNAKRIGYIVLFGDVDKMPTFTGSFEKAYSDRVYTRLAGNDNYPDAFISRISGDATQINIQLAKIIKYEQANPDPSYKNGLTLASNQGSPTDAERAGWLRNGGGSTQKVPVVAGGLVGSGYTFTALADPSATAAQVATAVNNGVGIICYIGHGSTTSWGSTGFSNTNIKSLNNGFKLPVIWSVACVNGQFQVAECFAEAWLRKEGGGAVAMEAASTNEAWVPPCDKQAATVNAYINNTYKTFGALEAAGCVKGLEVWGDSNSGQGNQMAEQCNLFGDCSMEVQYP